MKFSIREIFLKLCPENSIFTKNLTRLLRILLQGAQYEVLCMYINFMTASVV